MREVMSRVVFCRKLKKNMEGVHAPVYPGKLGKVVYDNISFVAWESWINLQTKMINELQLNMFDKDDRRFIEEKMKEFLLLEDLLV